MDLLEAIHTRRSIREYTDKKVPENIIEKLLGSAMDAPSAMNYQPWHFVVIDKREILDDMFKIQSHADMLKKAQFGILVCGDNKVEQNIDYLVQDCSAVTQNILLASHAQGLGSVWVSVYPNKDVIDGMRKYFKIPDGIIPISLVSIGYPAEEKPSEDRYIISKIHKNKW